MTLCDFCTIVVRSLCEGESDRYVWKESTFAESARWCELCRLITASNQVFAQNWGSSHIRLTVEGTIDDTDVIQRVRLRVGTKTQLWGTSRDTTDLDVWTRPGALWFPSV